MNARLKKLQSETFKLRNDTSQSSIKDRLASPSSQFLASMSDGFEGKDPNGTLSSFSINDVSNQQKQQATSHLLNHQFYRSTSYNKNPVLKNLNLQKEGTPAKDKDLQFLMKMNKPENKNQFQKSLAETLRIKREHQEKIEQERLQYSSIPRNNVPKESDSKGTAFRIRPQTPRLNLLKNRPNKVGRDQRKPQPLERRAHEQLQPIDMELINKHIPKKKQIKVMKAEDFLEQMEVRDDLSVESPKRLNTETENNYSDEDDEALVIKTGKNAATGGLFSGFEEKFFEIMDQEEIENDLELNEKFLSQHLDVRPEELARLTKIELRVDTTCHNLQATGEILSSIEYLKMNDSIIRCFRDLGTSFKFVRILMIARCELKEVQGILAFEHLEELYISYNFIEELFDIGFLEHLNVLDMEGNNIKGLDQIYYLKRTPYLQELNLKYNPVTEEVAYYHRIQECVPRLESLDDEIVETGFFERKTEETKKFNLLKTTFLPSQKLTDSELERLSFIQAFIRLGADLELMKKWSEEAVTCFEKEPNEEELLIKAIKTYSLEKKAQQNFSEDWENFENQPPTPNKRPMSSSALKSVMGEQFRRTVSEGFGNDSTNLDRKRGASSNNVSGIHPFKAAQNNSFFKTTRSTAQSTQDSFGSIQFPQNSQIDDSNVVSDLISNNDQAITGNPMSLLRGAQNKKRLPFLGVHTTSGDSIPKDIYSLINEFHQDFKQVSRDEIRDKFSQNQISLKGSTKKIDQILKRNQTSHSQSSNQEEAKEQDQKQLTTITGTNSVLASLNLGQKKGIRTAFNMGNGPIKADRIVLKPTDISFNLKKNLLNQ